MIMADELVPVEPESATHLQTLVKAYPGKAFSEFLAQTHVKDACVAGLKEVGCPTYAAHPVFHALVFAAKLGINYSSDAAFASLQGWLFKFKAMRNLIAALAKTHADWNNAETFRTRLIEDMRGVGNKVADVEVDYSLPIELAVQLNTYARMDRISLNISQLCVLLPEAFQQQLDTQTIQILTVLPASSTPLPFRRFEDAHIYGQPGQKIAPTRKEYEEGRVHEPALIEQVENMLVSGAGVLVSGHGASGKTTLSILLAHRPAFAGVTSFYLDLTTGTDQVDLEPKIIEAIAKFGNDQCLFVLDNAHLAPELAAGVVNHWRGLTQRSRLLLLARQTNQRENRWTISPSLKRLGLSEFELINGPAELGGAYQRLFRQHFGNSAENVPEARLVEWMALFKGDLVAFSTGVLNHIGDKTWNLQLTADDPIEYVREVYLDKLPNERDDLLTLAAVYDKEISLPVSSLKSRALLEAMKHGVVWMEQKGSRETWNFFRLVHPGIAKLMLRAADISDEDAAKERQKVLLAGTKRTAFAAIRILSKNGFSDEANDLRQALWSADEWPIASLPLGNWKQSLIDCVDCETLSSAILQDRARAWMEQCDNQKITALWSESLLHDLANFLRYAKGAMPDVFTTFASALSSDEAIAQLTRKARATPLHFLANFLGYAEVELPAVWTSISQHFTSDAAITLLIQNERSNPLGGLTKIAPFLRYTQKSLPELWGKFWQALWNFDNQKSLIDLAYFTSPEHLANFLKYVGEVEGDTKLRQRLLSLMLGVEFKDKLDQWLVSAGPEKLVALVVEEPLFEARVAEMDKDACQQGWAAIQIGQPTWFPKFAPLCFKLERPDLAEVAALQILLNGQKTEFEHKTVTIKMLSFILHSAQSCDFEIQRKFLDRCIPPEWLDKQFSAPETKLETLAGVVRSFAMHPSPKVRQYLTRPSLLARLEQRQPSGDVSGTHIGIWLQLLGSVGLLDDEKRLGRRANISSEKINEAIALWPATPGVKKLQFIQSALWAGLHEWLCLSKTSCAVAPDLAQGILAHFSDAQPEGNTRQSRLNAAMVTWLLQAQANEWTLPVPQRSMFSILAEFDEQITNLED
jgi:hypothetical protein